MKRLTLGLYIATVVPVMVISSPVMAQVSPPPNASPGAVLQGIQESSPFNNPETTHKKPPATEIFKEGPKENAPSEPTLVPIKEHIFIQLVKINGITKLKPKAVQKIVNKYENKQNTFDDFQKLAKELTDLYHSKGYITSRVYIPPQHMKDGILTLQASEGRVGHVRIKTGKYFRQEAVKTAVDLKYGEVFNLNDLVRDVREINDDPDLHVKATLKPGDVVGQSDIDFKVTDQLPIHLTPLFDNQGRRLIGYNRAGLTLQDNNVLGYRDELTTFFTASKRSTGITNRYDIPLGAHGTKIGMDFDYSQLKLGGSFTHQDVRGYATVLSPHISQTLINTDRVKTTARVAMDIINLSTDTLGNRFSNDRLRVIRPGIDSEEYDNLGRTFMSHELGLGFDWLGGTNGDRSSAGRFGAGSQFLRYTGTLTRVQKLPLSTYGVVRLMGQASPDRLVSYEEFQQGGALTVRGYREGQLIGDNGLFVSGEWHVPLFLIPKTWKIPRTQYGLRDNLQWVTFLDYGAVYVNKPAAGVNGSENIMGTGIGLRARLTRFLVAQLDLGFPLLRVPGGGSSPILHFGLQSQLF